MAQKLVICLLFSLAISASCLVIHRAPIPVILQYNDDPNYAFAYNVNDPRTGDVKSQQESRRGDRVTGQYSLIQPDGIKRTVDYRADDLQGFRATVNNARPEAERKPAGENVRAANNRQWQDNDLTPCEDCSIDPRTSSDVQWARQGNPIQWQIDYSNEPRQWDQENEIRERNSNSRAQRPSLNDRMEVQPPAATSRTSVIQRIENNQPVVLATIPYWV